MSETPPVRSVMLLCPHTIDARASATDALVRMEKHGIRHLPVVSGEEVVGIVSERDIAIATAVHTDPAMLGMFTVQAVSTKDPYLVDEDTPLDAVAKTMADNRIGSALVTRNGQLVGIVTTTDLLHALTDLLRGEQTASVWRR